MVEPKSYHATFKVFLERQGLPLTAQRSAILAEILAHGGHFEVDDLSTRLRKNKISASRATVYRTVNHLAEAGLLRKVDLNHGHTHYELDGDSNHHEHLVCEHCGQVTEFSDQTLEKRITTLARLHGFTLSNHTVQLFGRCRRCSP